MKLFYSICVLVLAVGSLSASAQDTCSGSLHNVVAGDTCFGLAQSNGITLAEFVAANPPNTCPNLVIGSTVCIPRGGSTATATTSPSSTTSATATATETSSGTTPTITLLANASSSLQCLITQGACSLAADPDQAFAIIFPPGTVAPTTEAELAKTPFQLQMKGDCMTADSGITTIFAQQCATDTSTGAGLRQLFLLTPVSGGSNLALSSNSAACVSTSATSNFAKLGPCSATEATWTSKVSGLIPVTPTVTPTTTATVTPPPSGGGGGLSVGAIVGIVIGGVAGLALIGGLVYYFTRNKNKTSDGAEGVATVKSVEDNVDTIPMSSPTSASGPVVASYLQQPPAAQPQQPITSYSSGPPSTTFDVTSATPPSIPAPSSAPFATEEALSFAPGATVAAGLAPPSDDVPPRIVTLKRGASLSPNSAGVSSYTIPAAAPAAVAAAATTLPPLEESPVSSQPASPSSAPTTPQIIKPNTTISATKGYIPREADEIEVRPKDLIRIEAVYEDGWCKGQNGRTGARGVLPGACFE